MFHLLELAKVNSKAKWNFQVYYHIDDEKTPYCTDVQVPPDKITLGDFKLVLNRSNFKYFCKAPAPDSGVFE